MTKRGGDCHARTIVLDITPNIANTAVVMVFVMMMMMMMMMMMILVMEMPPPPSTIGSEIGVNINTGTINDTSYYSIQK